MEYQQTKAQQGQLGSEQKILLKIGRQIRQSGDYNNVIYGQLNCFGTVPAAVAFSNVMSQLKQTVDSKTIIMYACYIISTLP